MVCGWSTPRNGHFTPGKVSGYPLYRRLGWPHGRSGWVRKISPAPGLDLRTVQAVVSGYTDCAIPLHRGLFVYYIVLRECTPSPNFCVAHDYADTWWGSLRSTIPYVLTFKVHMSLFPCIIYNYKIILAQLSQLSFNLEQIVTRKFS